MAVITSDLSAVQVRKALFELGPDGPETKKALIAMGPAAAR